MRLAHRPPEMIHSSRIDSKNSGRIAAVFSKLRAVPPRERRLAFRAGHHGPPPDAGSPGGWRAAFTPAPGEVLAIPAIHAWRRSTCSATGAGFALRRGGFDQP